MSSIVKFFEKKKAEYKFKRAGQGVKLSDSGPTSKENVPVVPKKRTESSNEARTAGAAALARFEKNEQKSASAAMAARSVAAIKAEAMREIEQEKQLALNASGSNVAQTTPKTSTKELAGAPMLTVKGVFFHCPLIGEEVLPRAEMERKIKDFLYEQLSSERGLTSCLIIHTCNKNQEKVKACIDTLQKYLSNILDHPTEEKYRKIKLTNKVFQERVAPVEGTTDFLIGAGFEKQLLPTTDDDKEEFWVFTNASEESIEYLSSLKEGLLTAECIVPILDRGMQVLKFTSAPPSVNLPQEFYNLTKEELMREQAARSMRVELNSQLRTKAMREKDEMREKRRYRYTLIRVRFPDGVYLQGTFKVSETINDLKDFVRENVDSEWMPFVLKSATGQTFDDDNDSMLLDLHLVPAVVVNFSWDPSVAQEVEAQQGKGSVKFLNQQAMALLQDY